MTSADVNYFVCTLGETTSSTLATPFETIPKLLEHQTRLFPERKAIGFTNPLSSNCCQLLPGETESEHAEHLNDLRPTLLTFGEVERLSWLCAQQLASRNRSFNLCTSETVALVCSSTAEFLVNWLALVQLGQPVLLLAPQCTPDSIAHLCRDCGVRLLLHDNAHESLARQSELGISNQKEEERLSHEFRIEPTISFDQAYRKLTRRKEEVEVKDAAVNVPTTAVAYLHHTSGTSSGKPKPIPQTHHAAVGVLPRLLGERHATFTTTPLYHGGIADLLRAWTSGALVWFYPTVNTLPLTADNVAHCLDMCSMCTKEHGTAAVKYFSSVPYVLQMLSQNNRALEHLQRMDIVGVGGAALPSETGDKLVSKGINLCSRFGSAECGFLMCSHRLYERDNEWQFLRTTPGNKNLVFEPKYDGLSELIVSTSWPYLSKTNRDNGTYSTDDLFQPHDAIEGAWKYHSRTDSQLTLVTGKKFDPAPLEAAIGQSPAIQDVFVFGSGMPYPGALLFRSQSSKDMSDETIIGATASAVEKANAEFPAHARLSHNMLIPQPHMADCLEKSSKGTVMRQKAEERYAEEINRAYSKTIIPEGTAVIDKDVCDTISRYVCSLIGTAEMLGLDTDLFSFGIDSVASIQIRRAILDLIPPQNRLWVPMTVVEDCRSITELTQFVIDMRSGKNPKRLKQENNYQLMLDLVEEYAVPTNTTAAPDVSALCNSAGCLNTNLHTVVLTGATGFLGTHVLDKCRLSDRVAKIYCLVRDEDEQVAHERIDGALEYRQLSKLSATDGKVIAVRTNFREPNLGLSSELYAQMKNEVTVVVHIAWAVNFRLGLGSFVHEHISGLRNLLNLAIASRKAEPPRFVFCSSLASVSGSDPSATVRESISRNPHDASPLGYSQSKWVAEQICMRAHQTTNLKNRIAIIRVGQLSGDSRTGIWNEQEAWPLLLGSAKVTGCLPDLNGHVVDWLPVDKAAQAFFEIIHSDSVSIASEASDEPRTFHLLTDKQRISWNDVLEWMSSYANFRTESPSAWLERLEKLETEAPQHPAIKLLGFWKSIYGPAKANNEEGSSKKSPPFSTLAAQRISPTMRDLRPMDRDYFGKLWSWIDRRVG